MKLCVDCEHFGKDIQMVGPGQQAYVPVCKHPEFRNPVDGTTLPPGVVRREKEWCGLTGKGWIKRTEDPQPTLPTPEKGRILTST